MLGDRIENGIAWLSLIALVVWLSACASVVAPKTPDQTVYAAYGVYTTVARTTADLVSAGTISTDRAREIQSRLDDVHPVLEQAREAVTNDETPTDVTMRAVREIMERLQALQRELQQEASQ